MRFKSEFCCSLELKCSVIKIKLKTEHYKQMICVESWSSQV